MSNLKEYVENTIKKYVDERTELYDRREYIKANVWEGGPARCLYCDEVAREYVIDENDNEYHPGCAMFVKDFKIPKDW